MGRKNHIFVMHFDLNPMHVVMVFELNGEAMKDVSFPAPKHPHHLAHACYSHAGLGRPAAGLSWRALHAGESFEALYFPSMCSSVHDSPLGCATSRCVAQADDWRCRTSLFNGPGSGF